MREKQQRYAETTQWAHISPHQSKKKEIYNGIFLKKKNTDRRGTWKISENAGQSAGTGACQLLVSKIKKMTEKRV